jgi:peptidoglycan-N-acetylglucosamine deacetylase
MSGRPPASVSLDLDDLWSYMKVHNDPGWERYPSYLDSVVPLYLELLDELQLPITVFVVGIDAERERNRTHLRALAERGHELGNHSHSHSSWLQRFTPEQLSEEVLRAHRAILEASGRQPLGFRGPGFSWTPQLLEILADNGYLYDASTFPTFLSPLARAYYFWKSSMSAAEREERAEMFGSFRDGFRPLKPYRWKLQSGRELLEMPVTTFPVLRSPFHQSYLLFLAQRSRGAMLAYLRAALRACRLAGVEPSFLLHPTDIFGRDLVPQLAFFPAMELPTSRKIALLREVLRVVGEYFQPMGMAAHAHLVRSRADLPVRPVERASRQLSQPQPAAIPAAPALVAAGYPTGPIDHTPDE